jgi:transcriptional regulator with XRE-family HTH domain
MLKNMSIIGRNLKLAREANGFTQSEVASFLNVDTSFVEGFERGEISITSGTLEQLANLYGCKLSEFEDENGFSDRIINISRNISELSEADLNAIHDARRIGNNLLLMSSLLDSSIV